MTTFDYATIGEGYYDTVYRKQKGIQSKWHHLKFKGIHKVLSDYRYDTILDLGCGPGTFTATLTSGKKCFGLDIAAGQIEYAQKYYGGTCQFLVGSATKLPFANESMDAVVTVEFIEHLPLEQIKQMLKEIHRCLKKEGILILTTPNYHSVWPLLEWIVSKISKVDYRKQHCSHFHIRRFEAIMREQGFKVNVLRRYLFLSPFFAIIDWRLADRIFEFEFKKLKAFGHLLLGVAEKNS